VGLDWKSGSEAIWRSGPGHTYELPTAEYVIHAASELESVRALAAEAAQATGLKFGVIVAEYSRSGWVGSLALRCRVNVCEYRKGVYARDHASIEFDGIGYSFGCWRNRAPERIQV